jgi:hypothetical protein
LTLLVRRTSKQTPRAATSPEQFGVLDRPDAVQDPPSVQHPDPGAHAGRPGELAGVRRADQPGLGGKVERRLERLGRERGLISVQPERHHPGVGEVGGKPRGRDGLGHPPVPGRGDHQAKPDVQLLGGAMAFLQDQGNHVVVGAEAVAVVGRSQRRLDPHRPGQHRVLHDLADQPAQVVLAAQDLAGRGVGADEHRERSVARHRRQRDPVAVGQLGQRRRTRGRAVGRRGRARSRRREAARRQHC